MKTLKKIRLLLPKVRHRNDNFSGFFDVRELDSCWSLPRALTRGRNDSAKGFVMVAALVILLALTVMGIMMINTATLDTKISGIEKDEAQALFLAEAGIAQVKRWIQDPDSFTPNADGIATDNTWLPPVAGGFVVGFVDCADEDAASINNMVTQCGGLNATITLANEENFFRRRLVDMDCDTREYARRNETGICQAAEAQRSRSQFADTNGDNTQDAFNPIDDAPNDRPALRINRTTTLNGQAYLNALFSDFSDIGRIESIEVYPPMQNYQRPYPICTVRVTARTNSGYIKTVEAEIRESSFVPINAGAEAGAGASWNGNGTVNWGDVLAMGNVKLAKNATPKRCDANPNNVDPWFKARIEGCVTDNGGVCLPPDNLCADNTADPATWANDDCMGCAADALGTGDSTKRLWQEYAVYQNQGAITLDTWDKNKMKNIALSSGTYYKLKAGSDSIVYPADTSGNPIGGTIEQVSIEVKALLIDADRESFIYVDAIDADGVTKRTLDVQVTGANFYSKGDLFVDGHLDVSGGAGGGIPTGAEKPDGTEANLSDINFDGVVYTTGNFGGSGSPKIFGGVVAEGGMQHSGTPTIWYDHTLKDGARGGQPRTQKGKWREIM